MISGEYVNDVHIFPQCILVIPGYKWWFDLAMTLPYSVQVL